MSKYHEGGMALSVTGGSGTFGMTPLFSNKVSSSPDWCTSNSQRFYPAHMTDHDSLEMRISHPPTNSPFT